MDFFRKSAVAAFCLFTAGNITAQERKASFDEGWRFYRGCAANAEVTDFDDSRWREVTVPHDWSIEPLPEQRDGVRVGPFSRSSIGRWDTGQTEGGEGWYRKTFRLGNEYSGKNVQLLFDGAYNQTEVWINGTKAAYNVYGYMPFKIDLSKYCRTDGSENVIAVKVINEGLNSRWYAGSGIYRHVWLETTSHTHFDEWDTFVDASHVNGKNAEIKLSATIHNEGKQAAAGEVLARIIAPDGKEVASGKTSFPAFSSKSTDVAIQINVKNAKLWSVENPQRYKAEISIVSNGKTNDKLIILFGIRTIEFTAEKGFLLNGKALELKGGCLHHDNGLLGAAAIDRAEVRKVELLKQNGFNAVRCSHNLPAEAFLNACDSLGILVIDEVFDQWEEPKRNEDYHRFFKEYSDRDMALMVRRDRNHPSIIMWSIGNEIAQRADDPHGMEIAQRLNNVIRKHDTTRPSTMGVNSFWDRRQFTWEKDSWRAFHNLGVAGYNYEWRQWEKDHEAYPQRVMYQSESYPQDIALCWNLVEKHPYIIGDFVWTAFDYVGEAGLAHTLELAEGEHSPQFMDWPWYNAWCGDIDLCGNKKPQSYFRDVVWRESMIAMAVRPPVAAGKREHVNGWAWPLEENHWNWQGYEGKEMQVKVYSRAPQVRLFLNGKLIGEKEVNKENYTAVFNVKYEPGTLMAQNIGSRKDAASVEFVTAGQPARVVLQADRESISSSHNDLSYVNISVVDKDGNIVPTASVPLTIEAKGVKAEVIGGNAHYSDMKSFRSLRPATFRGQAIAIVQPQGESGTLSLTVKGKDIEPASLDIQIK